MSPLYGYDFMKKLQDAGLIGKGVQRVVIDCKHDEFAVMYVQHVVDENVLDVVLETGRPEIQILDAPPQEAGS